jgi:hypothetical protein
MIAGDAPLDLDHVRAKIAEQHRAIWTGERFSDLNNADRLERRLHSEILS